ncbi:MAG: sugar phosphate isomerase/epimerase [Anaerolineaceae bacterium]|nr:sugar phosphate isomerase/epimerase [Anaerolineaceae bacterium]
MKISTATSVFVNYSIEDAAEAILQAGYDGIDLWCGRPHLYRQDHTPAELRSLRAWLETNRLTPVSCMPAFFRYPYSLSSPRATIRQESVAYINNSIDTACALSAQYVLVVPTRSIHGQSTADARAWYVDSVAQACRSAEASRIKLGIEIVYPAFSDFMNTTDDALGVIKEIGSPCLGIVLDTGHLNLSGEDLGQAIQKAGDYLLQVHVNDNDGRHQQNSIPGDGCFDFIRLVRLLQEIRYNGYLTIEIGWQYSFDPVPAVTQACERMHAYLSMKA